MKKILTGISLLSIALWACKKDVSDVSKYTYSTEIENFAKLKINFASVKRGNPNYQIKINDTRVSGLIPARYPYPGGGLNTGGLSNGDYLNIAPGKVNVKVSIPKYLTNIDSIVMLDSNITVRETKYYTYHVTDTAANMKAVLFEDDRTTVPGALPKFKLVNLMPNVSAVDLYFGPTLVASNIKYLNSSAEFSIDTAQTVTGWTIRETGAGATGAALATYASAATISYGRKLTAFAMGYKGLAGLTEPRRPFISFFYTR